MSSLFARLLRIRLRADEASVLGIYGSAGMAARDFLDYAADFGWFVPPGVLVRLFVQSSGTQHSNAACRRTVLWTLVAMAGLSRRVGLLHRVYAVRYGAERLVCSAYWALQDLSVNRLRRSARREIQSRECALIAGPLLGAALAEQASLLAVFATEMLFSAMDVLLDLHQKMPPSPGKAGRFEIARTELEDNLQSILCDQPKEETKHEREVA